MELTYSNPAPLGKLTRRGNFFSSLCRPTVRGIECRSTPQLVKRNIGGPHGRYAAHIGKGRPGIGIAVCPPLGRPRAELSEPAGALHRAARGWRRARFRG